MPLPVDYIHNPLRLSFGGGKVYKEPNDDSKLSNNSIVIHPLFGSNITNQYIPIVNLNPYNHVQFQYENKNIVIYPNFDSTNHLSERFDGSLVKRSYNDFYKYFINSTVGIPVSFHTKEGGLVYIKCGMIKSSENSVLNTLLCLCIKRQYFFDISNEISSDYGSYKFNSDTYLKEIGVYDKLVLLVSNKFVDNEMYNPIYKNFAKNYFPKMKERGVSIMYVNDVDKECFSFSPMKEEKKFANIQEMRVKFDELNQTVFEIYG